LLANALAGSSGLELAARCYCHRFCNSFVLSQDEIVPVRLKPVARSLSVRAEFFGLELEDWGLVIAWAILMRLIGDHVHRVFLGFLPVSTIVAYGSSAVLILLVRWTKHGKPRGYLTAWIQHQFRPKAHSARWSNPQLPYLIEDDQ
jgi:hypothetical protein